MKIILSPPGRSGLFASDETKLTNTEVIANINFVKTSITLYDAVENY